MNPLSHLRHRLSAIENRGQAIILVNVKHSPAIDGGLNHIVSLTSFGVANQKKMIPILELSRVLSICEFFDRGHWINPGVSWDS